MRMHDVAGLVLSGRSAYSPRAGSDFQYAWDSDEIVQFEKCSAVDRQCRADIQPNWGRWRDNSVSGQRETAKSQKDSSQKMWEARSDPNSVCNPNTSPLK